MVDQKSDNHNDDARLLLHVPTGRFHSMRFRDPIKNNLVAATDDGRPQAAPRGRRWSDSRLELPFFLQFFRNSLEINSWYKLHQHSFPPIIRTDNLKFIGHCDYEQRI
jgi:hypothetical protein